MLLRLMMRVLSTLPPNAASWSAAAFEKALNDAETPYAHRPLRKRRPLARRDLIEDPTYGMTIEELVALSGVLAEPGLHCDSCPDAESCKVLRPEIQYAHGKPIYRNGFPNCGNCDGKHINRCTFNRMPRGLQQQLHDLFQAHVPCSTCYKEAKLCDNNRGSCEECKNGGLTCEREACSFYDEPRDDGFCHMLGQECGWAHHDDGYLNVVHGKRPSEGVNMHAEARAKARTS